MEYIFRFELYICDKAVSNEQDVVRIFEEITERQLWAALNGNLLLRAPVHFLRLHRYSL